MKIFRPILQIYKKILMAFLREQRNAVPVIAKQIAAINRRKPDYSGYFGTPEGIRTPDTRLRRAVLCPAELLAHMQFLFVSVTPAVENPPNVRRRTLYPAELQAHMKLWGERTPPRRMSSAPIVLPGKGGGRNRLPDMGSGASPRSGPPAGDALRIVFYPIAAPLSTLSEKSPPFLGKILENKRLKKLRFSPLYAIISGCL